MLFWVNRLARSRGDDGKMGWGFVADGDEMAETLKTLKIYLFHKLPRCSRSQWLNFKLSGITCLVGKIKFKFLSQGPLAE